MKPQIENGFIQIATGSNENDVFSALINANLTSTEYQVILLVIRKTWGWKKQEDWISYTQFEKETGKSRSSVWTAIEQLVKKNILVRRSLPAKKTFYQVNKEFSTWQLVLPTKLVKQTKLVRKTEQTSSVDETQLVRQTEPTKETITKETIQKKRLPTQKDLESIDVKKIQEDYQVPESFVLSKWDDLINYCHGHGKKYVDFNRVLRKFVKDDAVQIRKDQNDKSKIVYIR
jgi:phage replication O-like protein O